MVKHGKPINFSSVLPWKIQQFQQSPGLSQQPAHQALSQAGPTAAQQQVVEISVAAVPGKDPGDAGGSTFDGSYFMWVYCCLMWDLWDMDGYGMIWYMGCTFGRSDVEKVHTK